MVEQYYPLNVNQQELYRASEIFNFLDGNYIAHKYKIRSK